MVSTDLVSAVTCSVFRDVSHCQHMEIFRQTCFFFFFKPVGAKVPVSCKTNADCVCLSSSDWFSSHTYSIMFSRVVKMKTVYLFPGNKVATYI